jgi:anti-sigma regulatory factor (Ser/Thr protein kinase)
MAVRRRTFAPHPRSVGEARHFVSDNIGRSGADPYLAALLTSELATNAVVHAARAFEVRVQVESRLLRVEIRNDEPELLLRMKDPGPTDPGGRGLHIVEAFAQRWGTESSRDAKVVWFELGPAMAPTSIA